MPDPQTSPEVFLPVEIQLRNNLEVTIVELTAERQIILNRSPDERPAITVREAHVLGALMLQPNTLLTPEEIFSPKEFKPATALRYARAALRDLTKGRSFLDVHIVQEDDNEMKLFALASDVLDGKPQGELKRKTPDTNEPVPAQTAKIKPTNPQVTRTSQQRPITESSDPHETIKFYSAQERIKFLELFEKAKKSLQIFGPSDGEGNYPHLGGLTAIDLIIAHTVYRRWQKHPAANTEVWETISQECPLKYFTKTDFDKSWVDFIANRLSHNPVLNSRISVRIRDNPHTGQKEAGLIWTPDTRSYKS